MRVFRLACHFSIAVLCLFIACAALHAGQGDKKPELTPLMTAAANDDLQAVRQLIAKGANVRQRTKTGETALYEAIERRNLAKDNLPIVDALLKAGADPNEVEVFDTKALVVSLTREYGNPEVTLLLLRSGARVPLSCEDGDPVVALATMSSSVEVLKALLAVGAPADCPGIHGQTALHFGAMNGDTDRVAVLLQYGANPNQRDDDGRSPLDDATTTSFDDTVQARFQKTRELMNAALSKATEK
jgi:ankyrin repeat protein